MDSITSELRRYENWFNHISKMSDVRWSTSEIEVEKASVLVRHTIRVEGDKGFVHSTVSTPIVVFFECLPEDIAEASFKTHVRNIGREIWGNLPDLFKWFVQPKF